MSISHFVMATSKRIKFKYFQSGFFNMSSFSAGGSVNRSELLKVFNRALLECGGTSDLCHEFAGILKWEKICKTFFFDILMNYHQMWQFWRRRVMVPKK